MEQFDITVGKLATATLVYGFCVAFTSIVGLASLILQNKSLLKIYIGCLGFVFLLTAGVGGYCIYLLDIRLAGWASVTSERWMAASDVDRSLAQVSLFFLLHG